MRDGFTFRATINFNVAFLNTSSDKEIYGIIKKIKDCKYFEKKDEEPAKPEQKAAQVEEEADDAVKSAGEDAPADQEAAFTSDVRGAEVCQEVPSDHQVPVSYL